MVRDHAVERQNPITKLRLWIVDGSGPRVRGVALRQRLVVTSAYAAALISAAVIVLGAGGPWISAVDARDAIAAMPPAFHGATALVLIATAVALQLAAIAWGVGLIVNGISLGITVRRWKSWKHQG